MISHPPMGSEWHALLEEAYHQAYFIQESYRRGKQSGKPQWWLDKVVRRRVATYRRYARIRDRIRDMESKLLDAIFNGID